MRTEKTHLGLKLSAILWLVVGTVPLLAQSRIPEKGKAAYPAIRLSRQVRNEAAISALGNKLPAVAAWHGKTTNEMARLLRHDRSLWVSPSGRLMYACEIEIPSESDTAEAADGIRDHIASFPLDQTFKLHSLPGSNKVIYLDFNGATITGTAWNTSYNGGADIVATAFSLDSDPTTFSTTELQRIQNIWKRVAEDYSPFNVDVTTEEPASAALIRSNSSDTQFGNRVVITPTNFYPNAGGVSYVGSFDDIGDYYKTSWAFSNMLSNGEKYIAEACSHESGHSVGLHHEGLTGGTTYYQGQGDWAPIMGNSYYKNVTQWAKGEYTGANNAEDQLQVMQNYGLAYYADDHGNTANAASMLASGSGISSTGFIERNTDIDVFGILAGSGALSVSVTPSPLGPDLKILAELRDAGWNLLASSSLTNLGASISTSVPAGTYFLAISGIGSGDPATTGYSDYASLGQYIITGTVADPESANPPTAIISAAPISGEAPLAVTFSGSGSTGDGAIVSYVWAFGDGSPVSNNPNPSHSYASAGNFNATLTVTDDSGLTDTASVPITVTKDIYVNSIALTSESTSTTVSATAEVTIRDRSGNLIPGAIITGSWSGIVQAASAGTTNASGVASLSSPQSSASGTFTFTATGVSAAGYTYNPQLNMQISASIAENLQPDDGDTISPSISITSPEEETTVSGIVSVLVNATDNVGVTKVELYVDDRLSWTSTTAPFTTKWNARRSAIGQHAIQVKAYDAAGNSSVSTDIVVNR
jgi:PKD repeat protein